jgi:triacylglycerol lipase
MKEKSIVLVHGYMDSHIMPWWSRIEGDLSKKYDNVECVELGLIPGTTIDSPRKYAEKVGDRVDELEDYSDVIDIVGHSMGGVDSRWYIEKLGGDSKVDSLTTYASPHQGTVVAYLGSFSSGGRDMVSSSDFINKLNDNGVSDKVEYNGIWGTKDMLVRPLTNAKIPNEHKDNVENYKLDIGHLNMVFRKKVFRNCLRKCGLL